MAFTTDTAHEELTYRLHRRQQTADSGGVSNFELYKILNNNNGVRISAVLKKNPSLMSVMVKSP